MYPRAKRGNLDDCTMAEMLKQWNTGLRVVEFDREQHPIPPIPVAQTSRPVSALISGYADRSSYFKGKEGPAPSDYTVSRDLDKSRLVSFAKQSSRPQTPMAPQPLRDVGEGIDRTRSRTSRCIAFAKQSAREPRKKLEDPVWQELEAEQVRIIDSLEKPRPKKAKRAKKKQPFAVQPSRVAHPFGHLMRDEMTPTVAYDAERGKRARDLPVPGFDIRQPALGFDRMVYRNSDAPDVFYKNVNRHFQNTIERPTSPVEIDRERPRGAPYDHMPHGCGAGDASGQSSTVTDKPSVDIGRLGERVLLFESPAQFKRMPQFEYPRTHTTDS
jgi:hypothetical protein